MFCNYTFRLNETQSRRKVSSVSPTVTPGKIHSVPDMLLFAELSVIKKGFVLSRIIYEFAASSVQLNFVRCVSNNILVHRRSHSAAMGIVRLSSEMAFSMITSAR